jgi:hypothetical protein
MKCEVEIDDKGEFIGTVPTELTSILDKIKSASHGEGYGKGAQKAAEEAKQQIADAIKAEKLKLDAQMPLEKAKWDEIDQHNKVLKTQLETTVAESRKRMTEREEAHAVELTTRMEALAKRNEKIKALVNANLRALAAQAGARDESLSELEVILQHRIGYDDHMEPYVKAEDGTPAKTTAGNPLGIDVFVKQYLDNHAHHRKPAVGRGGDARGGASLRHGGSGQSQTGARERVESGDRSLDAINELYVATRRTSAA